MVIPVIVQADVMMSLLTVDKAAAMVHLMVMVIISRTRMYFRVVVIFSVDTHRYDRAAAGESYSDYNNRFSSGRGYNDSDSFAGAHLKDIQWDMNSLIKFEKNFYHVHK